MPARRPSAARHVAGLALVLARCPARRTRSSLGRSLSLTFFGDSYSDSGNLFVPPAARSRRRRLCDGASPTPGMGGILRAGARPSADAAPASSRAPRRATTRSARAHDGTTPPGTDLQVGAYLTRRA
jgi:hypothetical protein